MPARPTILQFVAIGIGLALALLLHWSLILPIPSLVLDMTVDSTPGANAGNVEIWVNDTIRNPEALPLTAGRRIQYRFPVLDSEIGFLRIDPTNFADIGICIHSVHIEGQGVSLWRIGPEELSTWSFVNVSPKSINERGLAVIGANDDPQIFNSFPPILVPQSISTRLRWFSPPGIDGLLRPLALGLMVILMLGVLSGPGRIQLVIIGATFLCGLLGLVLMRSMNAFPPSVAKAVGWASYNNYPKCLDTLAVPILAIAAVLTALVANLVHRRFVSNTASTRSTSSGESVKGNPVRNIVALVIVILGLFCFYVPDLASQLDVILKNPYGAHWDRNNTLTWQYLIQEGQLPYKDFWFPYAGMYFLELAFPFGEIIQAVHNFLLWMILLLSIFVYMRKSFVATIALFGLLFGFEQAGLFQGFSRYGPILACLLAYVTIDQQRKELQSGHVLFWGSTTLGLYIEPINIILCTGIPIFSLMAIEAFRDPDEFCRGLLGRCFRVYLVPLLVVAGFVVLLFSLGLLKGFVQFLASVNEMAVYGGWPAPIESWIQLKPLPEAFVFVSAPILVALGLYGYLNSTGEDRPYSSIVLLLGVANVMLLTKQMVRPNMAMQILFLPISGFLFYLYSGKRWMNRAQRLGVYVLLGLTLGLLSMEVGYEKAWAKLNSTPTILKNDTAMLKIGKDRRAEIEGAMFACTKFEKFSSYMAIRDAIRDKILKGHRNSLFILGDDPLLYVLMGQIPPYQVNFYNGSPINEQRRICKWLEHVQPQIVVFNTKYSGVDGVPPLVRNPLVFNYVITHYVPETMVDSYAIMVPRTQGDPVAFDFWRDKLGSRIKLGHLPDHSSFRDYKNFDKMSGQDSADFLVITLTAQARKRIGDDLSKKQLRWPSSPVARSESTSVPFSIPVLVGEREFEIDFMVDLTLREYVIYLDRIWFWGVLRKAGFEPVIGKSPNELTVTKMQLPFQADILY